MMFQIFFTEKAKKDLGIIEKSAQKRIVEKLRFFIADNDPLKHAKKLKNFRLGTYRFRVGDYRIIFDINKNGEVNILMILRIKHRKEVYE